MQTPHLSDAQFHAYRERTLAPVDLIGVTDHLSACPACREQLLVYVSAPAARHLDYEEILAATSGSASEDVRAHLHACALCQAEAEDLRSFRSELEAPQPAKVVKLPRRPSPYRWVGAVAAALVVTALGVWWTSPARHPAPAPAVPQVAAEPKLPADLQQKLDAVLAAGAFPKADVLAQVVRKRGVLLGAADAEKSFDLTAPVGTAVLEVRPEFRWAAVPGASAYRVTVFDENFRQVADSGPIQAPSWTPAKDFPRGVALTWQVEARVGQRRLRAPVPPAPEARFVVAPAAVAQQIEDTAKKFPKQAILLATLCAEAGALDAAARYLDAAGPAAPDSLRQSLSKLR